MQAIPVRFDYLAFVQNWQISGCLNKTCVITPGENFTIHGLWPELKNGSSVIFCKAEPFDKQNISDLDLKLKGELKILWPSLYKKDVYKFWKHEWEKHGGCTGLRQDEYFRAGYDLRKTYDFLDYLEKNGIRPGDHASVDNITKALEAGISDAVGKKVENIVHTKCINAGGKHVLYEIVLCLDKNRTPKECPTRCRRRPLFPAKSDLPSPPPLPSIAGTVATDNSSLLQAY